MVPVRDHSRPALAIVIVCYAVTADSIALSRFTGGDLDSKGRHAAGTILAFSCCSHRGTRICPPEASTPRGRMTLRLRGGRGTQRSEGQEHIDARSTVDHSQAIEGAKLDGGGKSWWELDAESGGAADPVRESNDELCVGPVQSFHFLEKMYSTGEENAVFRGKLQELKLRYSGFVSYQQAAASGIR
jgi:hypothetical protein